MSAQLTAAIIGVVLTAVLSPFLRWLSLRVSAPEPLGWVGRQTARIAAYESARLPQEAEKVRRDLRLRLLRVAASQQIEAEKGPLRMNLREMALVAILWASGSGASYLAIHNPAVKGTVFLWLVAAIAVAFFHGRHARAKVDQLVEDRLAELATGPERLMLELKS